MADTGIAFKGSSFTLSVLHLKSSELSELRVELANKIAQAPDFFALLPIVVDIEKKLSKYDNIIVYYCKN
mgnify:CR=1 FL=1